MKSEFQIKFDFIEIFWQKSMKGLLMEKEEEERVVVMNAMKDANTGSCNMLRVVEEVASWPSIEAFEEEYRREQVLGSGRYDDTVPAV